MGLLKVEECQEYSNNNKTTCRVSVSSSCEKCKRKHKRTTSRRRRRRRTTTSGLLDGNSSDTCRSFSSSLPPCVSTTTSDSGHHHHLSTNTTVDLLSTSSLYQQQSQFSNVLSCCSSLLHHHHQYYSSLPPQLQLQQQQQPDSTSCHYSHFDHRQRKRPHQCHQHHPNQCVHNHQHQDLQRTHSYSSGQHHHHHHHQNSSTSSSSSTHFQRNSNFIVSVAFAIILLFSTNSSPLLVVMANPVMPPSSSVPKWINPCNYDLDSRSSSASSEGVDFQSAEARNLYEQIVSEVENNEAYVNEVKRLFVEETFGDPSFTEEFQWISYDWLPKIPSTTQENFATAEVSLKNSFEYLQHFAVAIEQMTMDQMIYEGSHLDQFRTMEKKLRNVLCLLQGAMLKLHVEANPDVTRGVMSEEYRSIDSDAMRNVRDYIIMREHAHALNFIHKAFTHFNNAQES